MLASKGWNKQTISASVCPRSNIFVHLHRCANQQHWGTHGACLSYLHLILPITTFCYEDWSECFWNRYLDRHHFLPSGLYPFVFHHRGEMSAFRVWEHISSCLLLSNAVIVLCALAAQKAYKSQHDNWTCDGWAKRAVVWSCFTAVYENVRKCCV